MKRTFILMSSLLFAESALANRQYDECTVDEYQLVFPHDSAERNNPRGEAAELLAELVNSMLDGRACMVTIPDAKFYSDELVARHMSWGGYQMAAPEMSNLGDVSGRFLVFELPFLFDDLADTIAYQQSEYGQNLLREAQDLGMLGLEYWPGGMKSISGTDSIRSPEDVSSYTFGVQQSPLEAYYLTRLGADVVEVSAVDLFDAMESQTVTAQTETWSDVYSRNLYFTQADVLDLNMGSVQYMLVTSEIWWSTLPEDLRRDLLEIIEIVTQNHNRFAFELETGAKIQIRNNGTRVIAPSDQVKAEWIAAVEPIWTAFEDEIGIDQITAAQQISAETGSGYGILD